MLRASQAVLEAKDDWEPCAGGLLMVVVDNLLSVSSDT